jgi:hypothetical protein
MLRSSILLLLSLTLSASTELPEDFPDLRFTVNPAYHSIGVKLGHALSVRRERLVLRTFEGELMLGFGTNPDQVKDRGCVQSVLSQGTSTRRAPQRPDQELQNRADEECTLFTNPWRFSFLSKSLFDKAVNTKVESVVVYYVNYYTYLRPSHLLMKTTNRLLNIFPVQGDLKIEPGFKISAWPRLHPQAGVITGRIVHASLEYPVRKTYEVIIQESENANNFRAMSVNDREMFQYITRAMLTGKRMRIEFMRLHGPHGQALTALFNYMTDFRIISVELLND